VPDPDPSFESLFELPGEVLTLEPRKPGLTAPARLLERLESDSIFTVAPALRELVEGVGLQPVARHWKVQTLPMRRGTSLMQVERSLDRLRIMAPWVFIETLLAEAEDDCILDRSGVRNIFWIPRPVSVHFDATDGKVHAELLGTTELDKFTRVFFNKVPSE